MPWAFFAEFTLNSNLKTLVMGSMRGNASMEGWLHTCAMVKRAAAGSCLRVCRRATFSIQKCGRAIFPAQRTSPVALVAVGTSCVAQWSGSGEWLP